MKALILNSGMGSRMGNLTSVQPKCMTQLTDHESILSRQLLLLKHAGIKDVVITTGYMEGLLQEYCKKLNIKMNISFVQNPIYDKTNYIYSMYLAVRQLDDDIVLMHGDLVFDSHILNGILNGMQSCMAISSTSELPEKDFKAVLEENDTGTKIVKVGVDFFDHGVAAQPLYHLYHKDWMVWSNSIIQYCENGRTSCYAETALNDVTDQCRIVPYDVKDGLCSEVDTEEDLIKIKEGLGIIR